LKDKESLRSRVAVCALAVTVLLTAGWDSGLSNKSERSKGVAPTVPSPTYKNPMVAKTGSGAAVENCPDPSIIRDQSDGAWYMYCTGDPLNDADKDASGQWTFHGVPILKSIDLVHWIHIGDVLSARPSWVKGDLWAPAIKYFDGKYFLYYSASATNIGNGASAIGVATSTRPEGPWTDSGGPVIEPSDRWTIDAEVIEHNGQRYIYFGSFSGGISVRLLSADGLHSDTASERRITVAERFEAANIIKRDGYYYLLGSSSNCCNGPLTGYTVLAARSADPLGPFLDRDGVPLLAGRAGGTIVMAPNGNRWVGPGHTDIFTDMSGQDWMVYHAIDGSRPYFASSPGFTKRPALMDPIDWVNGWPTVRGGQWASDSVAPKPAAAAGERSGYKMILRAGDKPGSAQRGFSDEFEGHQLGKDWTWVRQPSAASYRLNGAALEVDTSATELLDDNDSAPVLLRSAPTKDYVLETKMRLSVPESGCCFNNAQAGLMIYGDDDNYIKLVHIAIGETRQIMFGKEVGPVPKGYSRYGVMPLEAPGEWTWLRIVKRSDGTEETYTAYSSRDGQTWSRGGTWRHKLGPGAQVGLVAMNAAGFTATFEYFRIFNVTQ